MFIDRNRIETNVEYIMKENERTIFNDQEDLKKKQAHNRKRKKMNTHIYSS